MRWFLLLSLFLSSGAFAVENRCAHLTGHPAPPIWGVDGYDGKQVCFIDDICMVTLSQLMCTTPDAHGNYTECSYAAVYTGSECGGTGQLPEPPPVVNYCDSDEVKEMKRVAEWNCKNNGGDFVWSCDRDTGKIRQRCDMPSPDGGGGSGGSGSGGSDFGDLTGWVDSNLTYKDCYRSGSATQYDCIFSVYDKLNNIGKNVFSQQNHIINKLSSANVSLSATRDLTKNIAETVVYNVPAIAKDVSSMNSTLQVTNNKIDEAARNISVDLQRIQRDTGVLSDWDLMFKEDSKSLKQIIGGIESVSYYSSMSFSTLNSIARDASISRDNLEKINNKLDGISSGSGDALTQGQLKGTLNAFKNASDKQGNALKGLLNGQGDALNKTYGDIDKILNGKDNPLENKVFDNPFENVFKSPQAQCPEVSITMFGETAIIKDHCRALEVLNKFMVLVMWAWCGIALFNDAKEIYLRVTTNS